MVSAIVIAIAILFLPTVSLPFVESAIDRAVRDRLSASAKVQSSVTLGWFGPSAAKIEIEDERSLAASVTVQTARGGLAWVWSLLRGGLGDLQLDVSMVGRLEGRDGRAVLERIAAGTEADAENGDVTGEEQDGGGWLEGASLGVTGSLALDLLDRERGIDLAIRSESIRLHADAGRGFDVAADLQLGRVEAADGGGRVRLAGSISGVERIGRSLDLSNARGSASLDASSVEFDWERLGVSIEDLKANFDLDPVGGLGVALEGGGAVDGRTAQVDAEVAWRSPFDERGSLRGDLVGLGGSGRLRGVPVGAIVPLLPPRVGELVGGLGAFIDTEWSCPLDGSTLTAIASTGRAELEMQASIDRESGRLEDGSIQLVAEPEWQGVPGSDSSSVEHLPLRMTAVGIDYTDGELKIEAADLRADGRIGPLLSILLETVALEPLVEAPIRVEARSIRWRPADGIHAIEARGRIDTDAAMRATALDGDLSLAISGVDLEWFAEPLGRALSLRGTIGLDDGAIRLDQRFDGLWTGADWVSATSIRPHGTATIERLDPAVLMPLLPETIRAAWAVQSRVPIDLLLSTRVEGDRLEGALRAGDSSFELEVPLSVDARRIAIGPSDLVIRVSPEAFAVLPPSVTGGVELGSEATVSAVVEPVLVALREIADGILEMPEIAASLSLEPTTIESVPGLVSDRSITVAETRCEVTRRSGGGFSIAGSTSLGVETPTRRIADVSFESAATTAEGGVASRVSIAALELPTVLPLLANLQGTALADPAAHGWLGKVEVVVEMPPGGGAAITVAGAALDGKLTLARPRDESMRIDSISLAARVPPAAAANLATPLFDSLRPTTPLRLRARGRDLVLDGLETFVGELVLEIDPLALSSALPPAASGADADREASEILLAGHRVSAEGDPEGEAIGIRLGPVKGGRGATVGFDGRLARVGDARTWSLDGTGTVRGMPTALLGGVLEDAATVSQVLGTPFDADFRGVALSTSGGEFSGAARFPNGALDLPRLIVEKELLRIPGDPAFRGSVEFGEGLAAMLADLSPMLGSIDALEAPVQLSIWGAALPRPGVPRSRLAGDLRLDVGRGTFRPRGVLRAALEAFGDGNADGFVGEVAPLIARVRDGRLEYGDFEVRFVPYLDGWRNTVVGEGAIDLVASPAVGRFTIGLPATSLAAYSAEVRGLLETRPRILESIVVPVTLEGPLDGSAPMKLSLEFDPESLLGAGAEILLEEGLRRLFEGLR